MDKRSAGLIWSMVIILTIVILVLIVFLFKGVIPLSITNIVLVFSASSILLFASSSFLSHLIKTQGADTGKFVLGMISISQDVMRVLGGVFFGIGVVGILAKTPVEVKFLETFERRILHIFIETPTIADQVFDHIARADFVYKDYVEKNVISQNENGILKGTCSTSWIVRNISSSKRPFIWRTHYTDIDSAAGPMGDTLIRFIDPKTERVLMEWKRPNHNKEWPKMDSLTILMEKEQEIAIIDDAQIAFKTDNEIFSILSHACEGSMTIELTLPDSLAVECFFQHPAKCDSLVCYVKDDPQVPVGFRKRTAKIRAACLPYQGIQMIWNPKKHAKCS
jgi:hypothetical protein